MYALHIKKQNEAKFIEYLLTFKISSNWAEKHKYDTV